MGLEQWHRWWNDQGSWGLRRVLMSEWDPIGVKGAAAAQDEYDSYLGQLGSVLRRGGGSQAVAEYLVWAENRMGFCRQPDERLDVAERIIEWYASADAPKSDD